MEETFPASAKERKNTFRIGSYFFGLGVFGLLYALVGEHSIADAYWVLAPPLVVFGLVFLIEAARIPRCAITVDEDGIWFTRRGREEGTGALGQGARSPGAPCPRPAGFARRARSHPDSDSRLHRRFRPPIAPD